MNVKFVMLAFHDSRPGHVITRDVEVHDELRGQTELLLEEAFQHGQNEFQPVPGVCSVSVGDVALHAGRYWLVTAMGFTEISREQYEQLLCAPRRERMLMVFGLSDKGGAA